MAINDRRLRLIQQLSNLQESFRRGAAQRSALQQEQTKQKQAQSERGLELQKTRDLRPAEGMETLEQLSTAGLRREQPRLEQEQNVRRGFDVINQLPQKERAEVLKRAGLTEEQFLRSKSASPTSQASRLAQLQAVRQQIAQEKATKQAEEKEIAKTVAEDTKKAIDDLVSNYGDEEIASVLKEGEDIATMGSTEIKQLKGRLKSKERTEERKRKVVGLVREGRIAQKDANNFSNAINLFDDLLNNEVKAFQDKTKQIYRQDVDRIRRKLNTGKTLSVRDIERLEEVFGLELSAEAFEQYVEAVDFYNANIDKVDKAPTMDYFAPEEETGQEPGQIVPENQRANYQVGAIYEDESTGKQYRFDGIQLVEVE